MRFGARLVSTTAVALLAVITGAPMVVGAPQTPAPGTPFRDCLNGCPEMVVVPQGSFTMGAPAGVNRVCRDGYAFTSPVGSFPPNPFGLYDMLGDVMDWNEDCWNANYNGAPTDGTAWQSGDCGRRVVRGGSWDADLSVVRSANRRGIPTSRRNTTFGFRVARTL